MQKLIGGVKRAFSSSPSSRGSGSRTDDGSQDSARSSCLHRTRPGGLILYLAHDNVPMATDDDYISICSIEEMEKYESLPARVWSHSCIRCELAPEGRNE
jgi:hypothetical protein